jgi:hypothetical protein
MPKRKSTCVICGEPITCDRYQDVTAAGDVTRTYPAWGHDNHGLADRGLETPTPHWAHPKGGNPTGEFGPALVS